MKELMSILLAVCLMAGSASAELLSLENGGFEAGDPYPWSTGDFTGWHNATGAPFICLDGGTEGSKYMYTNAYPKGTAQAIQSTSHVIQDGYTYTLSADATSTGATQVILAIMAVDGGGVRTQIAGQGWNAGTIPSYGDDAWRSYSITYIDDGAYAGQTLTVYFAIQGSSTTSYGGIDNIQLKGYQLAFDVTPREQTPIFENALSGPTSADYDVVLDEQPQHPVTIHMTAEPNATITTSLTFDETDWDDPQAATLSSVNTGDNLTASRIVNVTFRTESNDAAFDGQEETLMATIYNDDVAAVVLNTGDGVSVSEVGETSDDYTIQILKPLTTDPVIVSVLPSDPCDLTVTTPLTFTAAQWYDVKTITVTARDDDVLEGDPHPVPVNHLVMSDDTAYDDLDADSVTVIVNDNECGAWGYGYYDRNQDCLVDLIDLSVFAQDWLACTTPYEPGCVDVR